MIAYGGDDMDMEEDDVYQYSNSKPGPVFAAIEDILRCAICRQVSVPPLSLPCCHKLFCSFCIRGYLENANPRCPSCRCPAEPSKLILSKELRSLCTLWKKNRGDILAAANAAAEREETRGHTDAGGGGGDISGAPPAAPAAARGAVGLGRQGARKNVTQRVETKYYHGMKESQIKTMLKNLGLAHTGDRATMIRRHRRLVLLDAVSADSETPVSIAELVRQVNVWSREKDREQRSAAARKAAASSNSSVSSLSNGSGGSASRLGSGRGSGVEAGGVDSSERPKVSEEMKRRYAALIAQAQARKKAVSDAKAEGSSSNKRPRIEEVTVVQPASKSSGGSNGGDNCTPTAVERTRGLMAKHEGHGGGGGEGGAVEGIAEGAKCGVVGGVDMQILGVAGKMIRTHGPWRCAFAMGNGVPAAPPFPRRHANLEQQQQQQHRHPTLTPGPANSIIVSKDPASISETGNSVGSSTKDSPPLLTSGRIAKQQERTAAAAPAAPAEVAVLDPGILYLNPATSETTRVPPPELLAQSEEADEAGGYLIFVPSSVFVAAAVGARGRAGGVAAAATAPPSKFSSSSMCSSQSKLEKVAVAVAESSPGYDGFGSRMLGLPGAADAAAKAISATCMEASPTPSLGGSRISGKTAAAAASAHCAAWTPTANNNDTLTVVPALRQGEEAWDRLASADAGDNKGDNSGVSGGGGRGGGQGGEEEAAAATTAGDSHGGETPRRGCNSETGSRETTAVSASSPPAELYVPVVDLSEAMVAGGGREEVEESRGGGGGEARKVGGRAQAGSEVGGGLGSEVVEVGRWVCLVCTFLNVRKARTCAICNKPKTQKLHGRPAAAATTLSFYSSNNGSAARGGVGIGRHAGSRPHLSPVPAEHHHQHHQQQQKQLAQSTITSFTKMPSQKQPVAREAVATTAASPEEAAKGLVGFQAVRPRERSSAENCAERSTAKHSTVDCSAKKTCAE